MINKKTIKHKKKNTFFLNNVDIDIIKDVATDIAWLGDPHRMIATSKDSSLIHHVFDDAVRPGTQIGR